MIQKFRVGSLGEPYISPTYFITNSDNNSVEIRHEQDRVIVPVEHMDIFAVEYIREKERQATGGMSDEDTTTPDITLSTRIEE